MPNRLAHAGVYPYLIAAICFSIQALGIGVYIAFGVFFNPLMAEFGWSRAAISGAASLAFFTMGVCGVIIGRLNDRFGPRLLMSVTALCLGLGCVLMARLSSLAELYLCYGLILGFGLSSIDVIALTTVARWFAHRRGVMTGIVKVGTGAGQFTIPLFASWLILHYGWRRGFVIIGILIAVILVVMAQFLRRDPGAVGLDLPRSSAAKTPRSDEGLSLGHAARTFQFWTICLTYLLLVFGLMTIMLHIVPHARDLGISSLPAASVLSAIGGVSMLGRLLSGLAIDRRGSKRVMSACFLLLLSSLVWLQFADGLWMLYCFAAVYGLAHGGLFTTISPLLAEWFGIRAHGVILGIVGCFATAGGASGPLMAGWLFDTGGSYTTTFRIIIAMAIVAWGLLLSLKPVRAGDAIKGR
jgi:MFS family permease